MANPMTFWDKLGMYIDAIGVENAGTAWDLSNAPMPDNDHIDLASMLIGGEQQ